MIDFKINVLFESVALLWQQKWGEKSNRL